jgi:hypothetical protein
MKTPACDETGMSITISASKSQRAERNSRMENPPIILAAQGPERDPAAVHIKLKPVPRAKVV